MKLKLLILLGLTVMNLDCMAMYTEENLRQAIENTIHHAMEWKSDNPILGQEEFLKEKGGEELYFESVKVALSGLLDVALSGKSPKENAEALSVSLKTVYNFSHEISEKVSKDSEDAIIGCMGAIIEYYYRQYGLEIEQETDPRLEAYIDYVGEATHDDWKGDE